MSSRFARVQGICGPRAIGVTVRMDTTGCRERGLWLRPLACSGPRVIGAGAAARTFSTPDIGDRTSGFMAELTTDSATVELASLAVAGTAASLPTTRP